MKHWDWFRMFRVWGAPPGEPDPAIEGRKLAEIEDAKIRVRLLDLKADLIVTQHRMKAK